MRFARLLLLLPLLLGAAGMARGTDEWRQWETAKARLHIARLAELERTHRTDYDFDERRAIEQAAARRSLRALASGQAPAVQSGVQLEAYLSANDDSAQPFTRYLPTGYTPTGSPPLLIFLHGYNPYMQLLDDPLIPSVLGRAAEACGACVAAPFGRCNTDYQGIGEQDVLRVIDEMQTRYHTDPQRVVLTGISMGGLGAWCIAARHPERFNGLLVVAGRGDFYTWHKLGPADLPPWQRRLVDMQFAAAWAANLTNLSVIAAHGMLDDVVTYPQGLALYRMIRPHNPHARFLAFPYDGHGGFDAMIEYPLTQSWLRDVLTRVQPKDRPTGVRVGETGSRLQDALLRPFVFVGGNAATPGDSLSVLAARADEWSRFSRWIPRAMLESAMNTNLAAACHLFVFGEPETSALARRILQDGGVEITSNAFHIAGRTLPRDGHGLWFTGRNPWNPQRLGIVQCGIAWGEHASDNHRYDRIPDVMVFTPEQDRWGYNLAVAAGYFDDSNRLRWYDPPVTQPILPPPVEDPLTNAPSALPSEPAAPRGDR